MPAALALQARYPDKVKVLLVEARHPIAETMAFAQKKRWLSNSVMWTSELCLRPTVGLPSFVLLSSSGEVVMHGSVMGKEAEILRCIESLRPELP